MERVTSPVAYATNGALLLFGMSIPDWAALVGLVLAIGTFALNWYFQAKRDRRESNAVQ